MEKLEKEMNRIQNKIDTVNISIEGWLQDKPCPTVKRMLDSLDKNKFKLSIVQAKLITKHTITC
jgi:phosphoglycolate phosphatase-like HAD superfamily hydrolase